MSIWYCVLSPTECLFATRRRFGKVDNIFSLFGWHFQFHGTKWGFTFHGKNK